MKRKLLLLNLIVILMLFGCLQEEKVNEGEENLFSLSVSDNFKFKTTKEVKVNISGENLSGLQFELYSEKNKQKESLLADGIIGNSGIIEFKILSKEVSEAIFLVLGENKEINIEIPIIDRKAEYKITDKVKILKTRSLVVGTSKIYYPSNDTYFTLAFEDKWPITGDYDLNDLVVNYNYIKSLDEDGNILSMECNYKLKAVGAGFENGFAIVLDIPKSKIKSVEGSNLLMKNGIISLDEKGLENNSTNSVIIVFDAAKKLFMKNLNLNSIAFINTEIDDKIYPAQDVKIIITFEEGVKNSELKNTAPFNPFIFDSNNRGKEIHLLDNKPTNLADLSLFGTEDDTSNIANGRYYKTKNNMPWGLNLSTDFIYPTEWSTITSAYAGFYKWAASEGKENLEWYVLENYFINSKLYTNTVYFDQKVEALNFSLADGIYDEAKFLEINTSENDVNIYYTLDGTIPNKNSIKYTGEIKIEKSVTVSAIGIKSEYENSEIITAVYFIEKVNIEYEPIKNEEELEKTSFEYTLRENLGNSAGIYLGQITQKMLDEINTIELNGNVISIDEIEKVVNLKELKISFDEQGKIFELGSLEKLENLEKVVIEGECACYSLKGLFSELENKGITILFNTNRVKQLSSDGNDYLKDSIIDKDNNIYMITEESNNTYIIKYDKNWKELLRKNGEIESKDFDLFLPVKLDKDLDGNIYILYSEKMPGMGGLPKNLLIKYDQNMNEILRKEMELYVSTIKIVDNNIYLTGEDFNFDEVLNEINIIKYDLNLNKIWAKTETEIEKIKNINDIAIDKSGNFYFCGSSFEIGNSSSNNNKILFVTKYDSEGNKSWNKDIDNDSYSSLSIDKDENVSIVTTKKNTNDTDSLLIKLDKDGNEILNKEILGEDNEYGKIINCRENGDIYIISSIGETPSKDIVLSKLDNEGEIIWSKKIGTELSDRSKKILIDSNNEIYVLGETYGTFTGKERNLGNYDIFILKYDEFGN